MNPINLFQISTTTVSTVMGNLLYYIALVLIIVWLVGTVLENQ